MAGSSCEREQYTGGANERTIAEIGFSKDLDLFETMCKILNIPMEVKKDMGKKTTDAMV